MILDVPNRPADSLGHVRTKALVLSAAASPDSFAGPGLDSHV
jgi:hypothetical protein